MTSSHGRYSQPFPFYLNNLFGEQVALTYSQDFILVFRVLWIKVGPSTHPVVSCVAECTHIGSALVEPVVGLQIAERALKVATQRGAGRDDGLYTRPSACQPVVEQLVAVVLKKEERAGERLL